MSVKTSTLIASSAAAARMARFHAPAMGASTEARKRVPTFAPCPPSTSAAASPRPSAMPPAASTGTGLTASTTWGSSGSVPTAPPAPPASPPWAMMMSTPRRAARSACRTVVNRA